jgi:hypothetical protein
MTIPSSHAVARTALAVALGVLLSVSGCGADHDFPSVVTFIPPQPSAAPVAEPHARPLCRAGTEPRRR